VSRRFNRRQVRFGGKGTFTPKAIAGLVDWHRADKAVTLNGGTVAQWNDQSGTGDSNKNVAQGTTAKPPTLNAVDTAYNERVTLSFVAANSQELRSTTWAVPLGLSRCILYNNGSNQYANYGGVGSGVVCSPTASGKRVLGRVLNGTTSTMYSAPERPIRATAARAR
jgi:hypothetical protein